MLSNKPQPNALTRYTEVKSANRDGAMISVDGARAALTTWDDLELAADQDASHHGRPVDDVTRALAAHYRMLLAQAGDMYRDACIEDGRTLTVHRISVGVHFATAWQLRFPDGALLHQTAIEPFGGSIGIYECDRVARSRGYAVVSSTRAQRQHAAASSGAVPL